MNNLELRHLSRNARQFLLDSYMRYISNIENILIRGVKTGEFIIEDTFLVAHKISAICQSWVMQRWYLRNRYTPEQFTNFVVNDILKVIQPK
jgi:alpha-ketoglutarate-dependent taurine dioxygenase